MKWSKLLHYLTIIFVGFGFLFWILAEITDIMNKKFLGIWQKEHLFNDAIISLLISLSFGIGTIIHMKLEKK